MPPGVGYSTDIDDDQMLKFSKTHKNGERTEVQADKIGTQATGGNEWLANVKDPRGSQRLGRFGSKSEARKEMKQWMKDHPKGVPGSGRGVSGTSGGIPGMDGNGLF